MIVQVNDQTLIGYNYSTTINPGVEFPNENDYLPCEAPKHTGTISTIHQAIGTDMEYQALRASGKTWRPCWFVQVDQQWHMIHGKLFIGMWQRIQAARSAGLPVSIQVVVDD